jgi:acetyl-CoA acetyltransferase
VLGGGEAAGPLTPPASIDAATYSGAADAAAAAYAAAGCGRGAEDVDYFSLYDCFPVAFVRWGGFGGGGVLRIVRTAAPPARRGRGHATVAAAASLRRPRAARTPRTRALEAVGLAPERGGGRYVERAYRLAAGGGGGQNRSGSSGGHSGSRGGDGGPLAPLPPPAFPINTHGGLLGLGAPWEAPAMHGVAEAVAQLRGEAGGRQVPGAARALVYGNGGVLSASAVAILGRCDGGGGGGGGGGGPEGGRSRSRL